MYYNRSEIARDYKCNGLNAYLKARRREQKHSAILAGSNPKDNELQLKPGPRGADFVERGRKCHQNMMYQVVNTIRRSHQ